MHSDNPVPMGPDGAQSRRGRPRRGLLGKEVVGLRRATVTLSEFAVSTTLPYQSKLSTRIMPPPA